MKGFAILTGFHLAGLLLQKGLGLPIPANVIGLMLFVPALFFKVVKLEHVEASAHFLLDHMLLFFTPFVVGTMLFFPEIRSQALSITVSLIAGSLSTILVAGRVTQRLERKEAEPVDAA